MKYIFLAALLFFAKTAFSQKTILPARIRAAFTYHLLVETEANAKSYREEIEKAAPSNRLAKFMNVASRVSKDTSTRKTGGSLEWVSEGEMVKSFEEALFSSQPQELVGPFKTEFGWHLIYVTEFREDAVDELCDRSLADAYARSEGQWKVGLGLAMQRSEPEVVSGQVRNVIGIDWTEPLRDQAGNLVFFRVRDSYPEDARTVSQHVELSLRQVELASRPKGCAISLRFDWEVSCSDRKFALMSSASFEGRGAVGRTLSLSNIGTRNADFRTIEDGTFGAKLHELACTAKQ